MSNSIAPPQTPPPLVLAKTRLRARGLDTRCRLDAGI